MSSSPVFALKPFFRRGCCASPPPDNFVPSSSVPEPPFFFVKKRKKINYSLAPLIFRRRTDFRTERTTPPLSFSLSIQRNSSTVSATHPLYTCVFLVTRLVLRPPPPTSILHQGARGGARFFSVGVHTGVYLAESVGADTFVTLYAPRSSRERSSGLSGLM